MERPNEDAVQQIVSLSRQLTRAATMLGVTERSGEGTVSHLARIKWPNGLTGLRLHLVTPYIEAELAS